MRSLCPTVPLDTRTTCDDPETYVGRDVPPVWACAEGSAYSLSGVLGPLAYCSFAGRVRDDCDNREPVIQVAMFGEVFDAR